MKFTIVKSSTSVIPDPSVSTLRDILSVLMNISKALAAHDGDRLFPRRALNAAHDFCRSFWCAAPTDFPLTRWLIDKENTLDGHIDDDPNVHWDDRVLSLYQGLFRNLKLLLGPTSGSSTFHNIEGQLGTLLANVATLYGPSEEPISPLRLGNMFLTNQAILRRGVDMGPSYAEVARVVVSYWRRSKHNSAIAVGHLTELIEAYEAVGLSIHDPLGLDDLLNEDES